MTQRIKGSKKLGRSWKPHTKTKYGSQFTKTWDNKLRKFQLLSKAEQNKRDAPTARQSKGMPPIPVTEGRKR